MKASKKRSSSATIGKAFDSADLSYRAEADERLLEAFFADKLSEDGRKKVLSWLAKELKVDADVVQDAVQEILTAKPGQEEDVERVARLRDRLSAESLGEPLRESKKPRITTLPRSITVPPLSRGPVMSVSSATRVAKSRKGGARAAEITLLIVDPYHRARLADVRELRRYHSSVVTVSTVKQATEIFGRLPTYCLVSVVAKDLSASARRSLKKALEVRGRQGPTFVEYQSSKGEKLIEFLAIEPSEPERPDSALIRKQQEEGVGRCLGKLGRPGRLIEAKWLLGMTNRQLAREFDISLKTVIAELAKGMKQLRGVIESDPEIDLPKKQT